MGGSQQRIVPAKLGLSVQICYNWMVDNNLSIQTGKYEFILFSSANKLTKIENFGINVQDPRIINRNTIKITTSWCLLGQ